MAMVYFCFPGRVDVCEVVEGFLGGARDLDVRFLMPSLEDAADAVLAIAPIEAILYGPSSDHEG